MSIRTVGSLALLASPASTSLIPVEEGGVLKSTRISSLLPSTQQLSVAVDDQPSAAANTLVFEAALAQAVAAGAGELVFPKGTTWLAEGTLLATVCLQLGIGANNITIRGQGEGITILKLKDSGNSHVINVDGASNIKIKDLTVDGNRANNTTTSWHGIRVGSSGVTGLLIQDVTAQNTRGYGFGLQGGDKKRVRLTRCTALDTGADGCDWKNTADNSEDLVIEAFSARRWGLDGTLTVQAGLDLRGPCQISNVWCAEGPADGYYIRFREGETVDPSLGAHRSSLKGFVCEGNSGATSIGVYSFAHEVAISGGTVSDCLLGVVIVGERNSVSGVNCLSCDDESFQVNATALHCSLTDCHSKGATGSGFRLRAPGTNLKGCTSDGDAVSGAELESTATGATLEAFECIGPGGVTSIGVSSAATDTRVIGGDISACFRGIVLSAARARLIGVCSHDNGDDGCVLAVGADDCSVIGSTFHSNDDKGLTVRSARARLSGNGFTDNTSDGLHIEATGSDTRLDLNRFNGNASALADNGTGTRVGLLNDGLAAPYLNSSVLYLAGTGSPEGVYAAPVGSQFIRTDGGAGTSFYVKESGTGNTGWVAK